MTRNELLRQDFADIPEDALGVLRDKTLMITGCTGMLGSLLTKLAAYANDVIGNNTTIVCVCRNAHRAKALLSELAYRNEISFIECDLAKNPIPFKEKVDYIVHAASITSSRLMVKQPVDVIMTSVLGTHSALEIAKANDARLLYLSSMEVYGAIAGNEEIDESTYGLVDILQARSCYPESKRLCENLCISHSMQYGTNACIARLASTSGMGVFETDVRALTGFVRTALKGRDIILKTNGMSVLNFVYTTDALQALLAILQSGVSGNAYNVANPAATSTIRQLSERIASIYGVGVQVEEDVESTVYAPETHLRMNVEKTMSLGWRPSVDIDDLINRLGQWLVQERVPIETSMTHQSETC